MVNLECFKPKKILNIFLGARFSHGSDILTLKFPKISPGHSSEYAWSKFQRVLCIPLVVNLLGLRIWQGCEYARVTQGAEYT